MTTFVVPNEDLLDNKPMEFSIHDLTRVDVEVVESGCLPCIDNDEVLYSGGKSILLKLNGQTGVVLTRKMIKKMLNMFEEEVEKNS